MKTNLLTLGLLLAGGISSVQAQQAATDLAVGKKLVCSDPNTRNWGTDGLTDGSWLPGRGTTFATNDAATFPKTVTVDLETPQSLGYVAIGAPAFGSTKTVSVSLSEDGTTYSEVGQVVFPEAEEKKQVFDFKATTVRYIKVTYLDHYQAKHGYANTFAFTTELAAYAPGAAPVLPPTPTLPEAADAPAPKVGLDGVINGRFKSMHESFLQRAKDGPIGVLFVGDSITDRWRNDNAKDTWDRFAAYNPANFGIGGDKTQHVLWRIENGELDGINPKVVVLMIGTNNLSQYKNEDIVKADTKIVAEIHTKLPEAKVLLIGIFPRAEKATDPLRTRIKTINDELTKLDDGNKTRYLDFGDKFLQPDGSLSKDIMPDFLHPSPAGYIIWADAMLPTLDEMMK